MRRYIQKCLAAFLCVCLLMSYLPMTALADPEGENPPVKDIEASTTVRISAFSSFGIAAHSEGYAAKKADIAANPSQYDLWVEITGESAPYTYTWTRAVEGSGNWEAVGNSPESTNSLKSTYEISKYTDTLEDGTSYTYKVVVEDSVGATVEATIGVTTDNEYEYKTLTKDNISVGATMHYMVDLAVSAISADSQTYGYLQQAAGGKTIIDARQVDLTGSIGGKAPFTGDATVVFPVTGVENGTVITVLCMDATGAITTITPNPEVVTNGTVTLTTPVLGAFALAYSEPDVPTYTITSSARTGGSISPTGEITYAAGATPSYVLLPDSGYVIEKILLDRGTDKSTEIPAADLKGNTYTFPALNADHTIEALFKSAEPETPSTVEHKLSARVEGGNGSIQIGEGTIGTTAETQVKQGTSATINFLPNDGYVIDKVTLAKGTSGEPQEITVLGGSYLLSAVMEDTTVTVTYKLGVTPPTPKHTITPSVDGVGGFISPSEAVTVDHGRSATFTITPNSDYRIKSVKLDGADITGRVQPNGSLTIENVIKDHAIVVAFEYVSYSVNASVKGTGGTLSPKGPQSVKIGESLTYYLYPDAGYSLESLMLKKGSEAAIDVTEDVTGGVYILSDIRGDYTLEASFVANPVPPEDVYYTITPSSSSGGSISPDKTVRVKDGSSQTFYFVPDAKHDIEQVTVNDAPVDVVNYSYTITNVSKNTTIHVAYKQIEDEPIVPAKYTVSTSAGTGGSVSPKGTTTVFEHGSLLIEFLPDSGYVLDAVSINGQTEAVEGNSYRLFVDDYKDEQGTQVEQGNPFITVFATFKAKDVPVEPEYHLLIYRPGIGGHGWADFSGG